MPAQEIIKAVLIFDKKSENPYISYLPTKDFNIIPILIMSFLTTVLNFSKKIGQSELKLVDMENFRFIFTEKKDIIFSMVTTKLANPMDLSFKLNTIVTIFLNSFAEDELSDPNISKNYFDNFLHTIDEIINGNLRDIENIKKSKIKEILDRFNEDNLIIGSGILAFTGNILVDAFYSDKIINLIRRIFNSLFEMKVFGINKVIINFQNQTFYCNKVDNETLLVVVSENGQTFEKIEENIENIRTNIKNIITEPMIS